MPELFEAKLKWSTTKVGDIIETTDGKSLTITSIDKIEWHGDRNIFIFGMGIPTSTL